MIQAIFCWALSQFYKTTTNKTKTIQDYLGGSSIHKSTCSCQLGSSLQLGLMRLLYVVCTAGEFVWNEDGVVQLPAPFIMLFDFFIIIYKFIRFLNEFFCYLRALPLIDPQYCSGSQQAFQPSNWVNIVEQAKLSPGKHAKINAIDPSEAHALPLGIAGGT